MGDRSLQSYLFYPFIFEYLWWGCKQKWRISIRIVPKSYGVFGYVEGGLLFLPFFLLLTPKPSVTQRSVPHSAINIGICFHRNRTDLSSLFQSGNSHLSSFSHHLSSFQNSATLRVQSIHIISKTSPRNSSRVGEDLSRHHSTTVQSCLRGQISLRNCTFSIRSHNIG